MIAGPVAEQTTRCILRSNGYPRPRTPPGVGAPLRAAGRPVRRHPLAFGDIGVIRSFSQVMA